MCSPFSRSTIADIINGANYWEPQGMWSSFIYAFEDSSFSLGFSYWSFKIQISFLGGLIFKKIHFRPQICNKSPADFCILPNNSLYKCSGPADSHVFFPKVRKSSNIPQKSSYNINLLGPPDSLAL